MSGFYVTLIFFGILLVLFSLLFIALDKKKVFNFTKSFDEKKQQLTEILSDAEQMIEELNRFSDYIVNQMDLKNEELNKNLKAAEDKVRSLNEQVRSITSNACVQTAVNPAADGSPVQPAVKVVQTARNTRQDTEAEAQAAIQTQKPAEPAVYKKKDKVIPLHNKYSEVLRLSRQGMESIDIARGLNMGKGEVELIIGLRNEQLQ